MGSIFCGCYREKDETDGKKGKPLGHDPDFRGPIRGKSRRPKDLLCLLVFLLFIILMGVIAVYAWVKGEPRRILFATDSKGRLCGVDQGVRTKPNLLFFDLTKCAQIVTISELIQGNVDTSTLFTCPTPQVCVETCPTANEFGVRSNPVCVDGINVSQFDNITRVDPLDPLSIASAGTNVAKLLDLIRRDKCAPYYILSTSVANRCVPIVIDIVSQAQDVFNFSSSSDLLGIANMTDDYSFEDLVLNVTLQDIVDGTFSQELLVTVRQFLLDVYQDFLVVWPAMIIGLVVAMILSFTYICLLRFLAGPIIVFGIFLFFFLVSAVSAFSYYQFYCFQDAAKLASQFLDLSGSLNISLLDFATNRLNTTAVVDISATICASTAILREFIDSQLPWFQYQEYTWLAIGILGTLVVIIFFIVIIFLAKKIAISIAIIKEASKAVGGVPTSVFYPGITWSLLVVLFLYWGVVAVFLLTASEPTYAIIINSSAIVNDLNLTSQNLGVGEVVNGTRCDPLLFNDTVLVPNPFSMYSTSVNCQFAQYVTSNFLLGIHIYHLFGLFWLSNFVLALGEVTLAGAFASWYWAFNKKKDVPTFALLESFGRAILFHSGSIAFGALIIALVQIARVILGFIQKKVKDKTGKVAKVILCMLQCCLWCFEKILRYINRQAYVEIAIYGYDFCTGACKAVKLLLRNIVTTAIKDRIVTFLLFLGKIVITGIVGILAYIGFSGFLDLGTKLWGRPLNYYLLPVIILVIAAYLIASGFMTVYHMAVDTIFICALEDLERNNGRDKPYFMSKQLMKLLHAKNEKSSSGDRPDGETFDMESIQFVQS